MARIQYVAKLAVDKLSGLPLPSLVGQTVTIVRRGTTTPVSITEDEAGTLVIPSSARVVSAQLFIPGFWVNESDMPVSALGGGIEVPLETAEGIAKRLDSLEPALLSASGAAVASAETVATLKTWVELGITRRNVVKNPSFETGLTGWQVTGGAGVRDPGYGTQMWAGLGYRSGSYMLRMTADGTSRYLTATQAAGDAFAVTPGQWVGVTALVASDIPAPGGVRVDVECSGTETTYHASGTFLPASFYAGRRIAYAFQVPATAATALVRVQGDSGSATFLAPTTRIWADNVLAVVAQTESEALASVATYFDGDTPTTPYRANRWTGTPHASVSEQLDMSAITDQKLPAGGTMGQALVKVSNNDRDVAWGTVAGGGGGTNVHGLLSGLDADDHPQYLNNSRGDARYYTKSQVDTAVNNAASAQSSNDRNRANHTGTQPIASIAGLQPILDGLGGTAVNSVAGKTGTVVLVSSDISDTGATGREIMGATTAAAVRTAAGAAATSHTHTDAQISNATATGRSILTASSSASVRGLIGAGTSSLELGTTGTTALRGDAIQVNPASIVGLPVGTLIARTA